MKRIADAVVVAQLRQEMDRLQDVLRSSPDGACELLLPALGLEHPGAALARLRTERGLDIESVPCLGLHERGTKMHRRFRWWWQPRARQLELGAARR